MHLSSTKPITLRNTTNPRNKQSQKPQPSTSHRHAKHKHTNTHPKTLKRTIQHLFEASQHTKGQRSPHHPTNYTPNQQLYHRRSQNLFHQQYLTRLKIQTRQHLYRLKTKPHHNKQTITTNTKSISKHPRPPLSQPTSQNYSKHNQTQRKHNNNIQHVTPT